MMIREFGSLRFSSSAVAAPEKAPPITATSQVSCMGVW
jgi:hypothetical protein